MKYSSLHFFMLPAQESQQLAPSGVSETIGGEGNVEEDYPVQATKHG